MNQHKRLLSGLLTIIFVICSLPVMVLASAKSFIQVNIEPNDGNEATFYVTTVETANMTKAYAVAGEEYFCDTTIENNLVKVSVYTIDGSSIESGFTVTVYAFIDNPDVNLELTSDGVTYNTSDEFVMDPIYLPPTDTPTDDPTPTEQPTEEPTPTPTEEPTGTKDYVYRPYYYNFNYISIPINGYEDWQTLEVITEPGINAMVSPRYIYLYKDGSNFTEPVRFTLDPHREDKSFPEELNELTYYDATHMDDDMPEFIQAQVDKDILYAELSKQIPEGKQIGKLYSEPISLCHPSSPYYNHVQLDFFNMEEYMAKSIVVSSNLVYEESQNGNMYRIDVYTKDGSPFTPSDYMTYGFAFENDMPDIGMMYINYYYSEKYSSMYVAPELPLEDFKYTKTYTITGDGTTNHAILNLNCQGGDITAVTVKADANVNAYANVQGSDIIVEVFAPRGEMLDGTFDITVGVNSPSDSMNIYKPDDTIYNNYVAPFGQGSKITYIDEETTYHTAADPFINPPQWFFGSSIFVQNPSADRAVFHYAVTAPYDFPIEDFGTIYQTPEQAALYKITLYKYGNEFYLVVDTIEGGTLAEPYENFFVPSTTKGPFVYGLVEPVQYIKRDRSAEGDTVNAFIERLYNVVLGRPSDVQGMHNWVMAAQNGATGADLANGFLLSPEFLNTEYRYSDFVQILYKVFFNREADPAGLETWVTALENGMSKTEVISGFINSTEWANTCLRFGIKPGGYGKPSIEVKPKENVYAFVTRLYENCLGRTPDSEGLESWAIELANMRVSGIQAADGFFHSDEFMSKDLSDDEYLDILYNTFLGRPADQAGLDSWKGHLANGMTRDDVLDGFTHSREFTTICVSYRIAQD